MSIRYLANDEHAPRNAVAFDGPDLGLEASYGPILPLTTNCMAKDSPWRPATVASPPQVTSRLLI